MQSLATVTKIPDPERRARAAARLIREADQKADAARTERDLALLSLRQHEGWEPVACYRLVGVSRNLFARMTSRAPADLPPVPDAKKVAVRAHRNAQHFEDMITQAREMRDEVAEAMLSGTLRKPTGEQYRNADVARLLDLTTARIAQLRQGRR